MALLKRWLIRVLMGLDRLANAFAWGHDLETISSRVGRNAEQGERFALLCCRFINWMFDDPQHCHDACVGLSSKRVLTKEK